MASSPTQPLLHNNGFMEANCILATYRGHFIALAFFFFFFPILFSFISLPPFFKTIILSQAFLNYSHSKTITVALAFIYALFVYSLSVAGIATTIYSTHNAFDRRPLSLFTTIKSLSTSFFPLSSTIISFAVCLILICIVPLIYAGRLVLYLIKIFGFEIDYSSTYFIGFCVFALIIVVLFLNFCQVYCVLASLVTVVESKTGFEPLRRSYYLIKQLKSDSSLAPLLLNGILTWIVMLGFSYPILSSHHEGWSYWDAIGIAITSLFVASRTVQFVAAATVLYLHCKDLQGESRIEIEDGIPNEYTSLARDDNKLPHESRSG